MSVVVVYLVKSVECFGVWGSLDFFLMSAPHSGMRGRLLKSSSSSSSSSPQATVIVSTL